MISTAEILYGDGHVPLRLDPGLADWHLIRPKAEPALPDPEAAFRNACLNPIRSPPLREIVRPDDRVVIVTSDGTRPVPNHLLIPWLLDELPVPAENVTVLLGTGTHRPNTPEELDAMFGPEVVRRVRIVSHTALDAGQNEQVGTMSDGTPVVLDKAYVRADKRIAVGFIEPHFFAGFSGGAKAVAPGLASIDAILHLHSYEIIGDPNTTWAELDANPLQSAIAEMVAFCPPEFLVNVTLNNNKAITGFFAGHYILAHRAGCEHVRQRAMVPVPHPFPVVVTSNSGYPLDQSVYQAVKGMSAAARIVEQDGVVIIASECRDGVPGHGNFGEMLRAAGSVEDADARLRALPGPVLDQWEVQALLGVRRKCEVALYSSLEPGTVRACLLTPVADLQTEVEDRIRAIGGKPPVAVLPEGPLTIPYAAD